MSSISTKILENGRNSVQREALEAFSYLSSISVPTMFFKIGIMIILFEHWFEAEYHSLAFTPYSTRTFIGVHLWPSQIWFIFLGTGIAVGELFKNNFRIPLRVWDNAMPICIVLAVYTIWSFYGFMAGNKEAITLFREMVFPGISFPAIVYLARHVDVKNLFNSFVRWSLLISLIIAFNKVVYNVAPFLPGAQNGLLLLSSFAYSFFLFKAINKSVYIIPAIVAILPILLYLNKTMLATSFFILVSIVFISTIITEKKNKYSVSKRSLKISGIIMFVLGLMIVAIIYLNSILDGRIERAFRENFIKERVTESGEIYMGDMSGGRMIIWGNAIKLWKQNPIFGNGMGTAVPIRNETIAQIHNYYLQALMDTGLVGTIILIICWFKWYRRVFRTIKRYVWDKEKNIYASMLSVVVAYFFYAFINLPMIHIGAAHFFWVVVALLTVMPVPESNPNKPN